MALGEACGELWGYGAAHGGRSGGGDQRDERAVDELLAHVGVADEQSCEAWGDVPNLDSNFFAARSKMAWVARAVRGVFSLGFQTTASPADEGEGGVPAPDGDGEVEGGDDADDAEGVPGLHHAVLGRARRGR